MSVLDLQQIEVDNAEDELAGEISAKWSTMSTHCNNETVIDTVD